MAGRSAFDKRNGPGEYQAIHDPELLSHSAGSFTLFSEDIFFQASKGFIGRFGDRCTWSKIAFTPAFERKS